MVCRCGPTATTGSRAATGAPGWTTPPEPGRPVRPNVPAPTNLRRGSWPSRATPPPSKKRTFRRGRGCGASGSPCSAPGCSLPPLPANAPPPAVRFSARAPARQRFPSTACAVPGCPSRWPSAPTAAPHVGCAPTATSPRRCWRPASSSPTPTIPPPRGSTTHLPTPYGHGWPPSKSGRAQSTSTSHQHHLMLDRPGPAATNRWPLLSKQHSAYLRTDQARLDVADPAETTAPQAVRRCMTHNGPPLSLPNATGTCP